MGMETIRTKIDELIAAIEAEGLTPSIDIWFHASSNPGRTFKQNICLVKGITGEEVDLDYYDNNGVTIAKSECGCFEIMTSVNGDHLGKGVAYLDGLHENSK
jgi:hypothetical protein